VSDGDGSLGIFEPDSVPILHRDGSFLEGRNEVPDRLVDADLPFLDQVHDGGAGDRLGLRGYAEQGAARHFAVGFLVREAHCTLVHRLAILQDHGNGSSDLALGHVVVQQPVDPGDAFFRRSGLRRRASCA
jgi:hypothetical protein